MWSRFDCTFGELFDLSHSGRDIYSMKLWYSHHAFFHSLLASIIFGILLLTIICFFKRMTNKSKYIDTSKSLLETHFLYFIVFILGYWAHLLGDLPTPASSWGGIAFMWPSNEYIGGFGKIWWWNNYDIFLLILSSIFIILIVPILSGYIKRKARLFSTIVLSITLCLIILQINTRKYDYNQRSVQYAQMEQNSKEEQKRILGKHLYEFMSWFDNQLKFYF